MTLRTYLQTLNEFAKENPSALDYIVVTSIDDEGNGYNTIKYQPYLGLYANREFTAKDSLEEQEQKDFVPNAVCVN